MRIVGSLGHRFAATGIGCALLLCSAQAALSVTCRPNHFRPPFFIKSMGACAFDPETLSFAGTPIEQAKCLMRGMDATRNLAPPIDVLPVALADRVGTAKDLPARGVLSAYLSRHDLEWDFAANLWQPVSHARDNDPDAPEARYFVIHDTSGPNFGHRAFPGDIDEDAARFNNLANFACDDGWGKAHIVVNRAGEMIVDHDFAIPWRETKFEQAANFDGALKGLFLHIEMIQPRRAGPHGRDAGSPDPAFSPAQYDRLALLYTIASVRAGRWLIPAFHAALDSQIFNGHDDPLNFNIESFADSVQKLADRLAADAAAQAPPAETIPDPAAPVPWIDAQWDIPWRPIAAVAMTSPIMTARISPPPTAGPHLIDALPNQAAASATADITGKLPPSATLVAHQAEPPQAHEAASADACKIHLVKGHRRRICGPERAERPRHNKRIVGAAAGTGHDKPARHHEPRHARASSRHGRA